MGRSRLVSVAGVVVLLAACTFEGELGNVRFTTNLIADGQWWTPELGIADGQVAAFSPHELVDGPAGEAPALVAEVRGVEELLAEPGTVAVSGRSERGRIRWSGEAEDWFPVRFVAAERAVFVVPGIGDVLEGPVAVLEGSEVELALGVRDRRGRSLGFAPDSVEVLAEGTASAWLSTEPGLVVVSGDQTGAAGLVVALGGEVLPSPPVDVVAADAVTRTEVLTECPPAGGDCLEVVAGYTADGTVVLGL